MAEVKFPCGEHAIADKAARRRALESLAELAGEAALLRRTVAASRDVNGRDAQRLADLVQCLTRDLSVLGALREVREWHEADQAEEAATAAGGKDGE